MVGQSLHEKVVHGAAVARYYNVALESVFIVERETAKNVGLLSGLTNEDSDLSCPCRSIAEHCRVPKDNRTPTRVFAGAPGGSVEGAAQNEYWQESVHGNASILLCDVKKKQCDPDCQKRDQLRVKTNVREEVKEVRGRQDQEGCNESPAKRNAVDNPEPHDRQQHEIG